MKFISWNVNGLRAVVGKNFCEAFEALDADFFCLQETKMQAGQLDLEFLGYHSFWNYAEKKGYSGTCIYTKHAPLSVRYPSTTARGASSRWSTPTSSSSAATHPTLRTVCAASPTA